MRRAALLALLAAVAAVTALAAAPAPAAAATEITAAKKLETAVIQRTNAVRKAHGRNPLRAATRLNRAGRQHVVNMARHGYFAHRWSNGDPFGTWIRRYWPGSGYRSWSAGENLYWEGPSTTARRIVRAWMNSPGHRRNLLSRDWRRVGVGAVRVTDPIGTYSRVPTAFIIAAEYGYRSG
jgi:uncharacterized protein YkwD